MIRMPHTHHRLSLPCGKHVGRHLTPAWHPVALSFRTRPHLVRQSGSTHPMEELLSSAFFLWPFFRFSLSSRLNVAFSIFSGKYWLCRSPLITFLLHKIRDAILEDDWFSSSPLVS